MSPGSRRVPGSVARAHMTKQKAASQEAPAPTRRKTRSPPPPLISADQPAPTHNPHCIVVSPTTSPANPPGLSPPNTPPPLARAYRSSAESVSGRSSSRSSPEAPYSSSYPHSALHSGTRISHSPEATYATDSRTHLVPSYGQNIRSWEQHSVDQDHRQSPTTAGAYGYADADQAHSPASSTGGHLTSQAHSAHPVSPHSPYGYASQYGIQHGGASHISNGIPASRTAGQFLSLKETTPPAHHILSASARLTPPPPLVPATPYTHSYPSGSNNTLASHDSSTTLSIAGYNTRQEVSTSHGHSSNVTTPTVTHQSYPHHYISNSAPVAPSPHHYTPHGTPSQSRQNSPPVVLAPIQSDRLSRSSAQGLPSRNMLPHAGSTQQPQQSSQPQPQHSALPVDRVSSSHGPHGGLTTSYSHVHQSQSHHTHSGHNQYPYSNYSTLSANHNQHHSHSNNHHDNWRSEHYHSGRQPLTHAHSIPSTGLTA
jgi:hypothetical protein